MHRRADGDVVAARGPRRAQCGVGRLEIRGCRGAGTARRGEETKPNTNNETTHTTSSLFVVDELPNRDGWEFGHHRVIVSEAKDLLFPGHQLQIPRCARDDGEGDPQGTTGFFGSNLSSHKPLFRSFAYVMPSRTTAPHVIAAFGIFPFGAPVLKFAISRPCARRSPRSSPDTSNARKPALYAPT